MDTENLPAGKGEGQGSTAITKITRKLQGLDSLQNYTPGPPVYSSAWLLGDHSL